MHMHAAHSQMTCLQKTLRSKSIRNILLGILLFLVVVLGITALSFWRVKQKDETAIYCIEGDTVRIAKESNLWYQYWSVHECLKEGDYHHTITLFLVKERRLVSHVYDHEVGNASEQIFLKEELLVSWAHMGSIGCRGLLT